MPEKEKPPARPVDIYLGRYDDKTDNIFKNLKKGDNDLFLNSNCTFLNCSILNKNV